MFKQSFDLFKQLFEIRIIIWRVKIIVCLFYITVLKICLEVLQEPGKGPWNLNGTKKFLPSYNTKCLDAQFQFQLPTNCKCSLIT